MKQIKNLLLFREQEKKQKTSIDKNTVFYVFSEIIKEEYGKKGRSNVEPTFYKEGKIFIKINNSIWANEIWFNKEEIIRKVNQKLGDDEIKEIKI